MGTRFSWDKEEPGSAATGSFRFSWEREADEKQADTQDMLLARPEVRNAAARMNTTPSAAPGLTAPKTDGLTTEIPLAKRSYQHANSILDTLRAPVTEQDVMARVKEMNAQAQKTLRDLDSQFRMNVDMGNLVYAKEIQQKRLDLIKQSKALTPAEAKRQLMSERSRDLVKAQPQDEDAWNTYAVNTLGWQDANRFQTDPTYRAMTKQAYQQKWAEDARVAEAKKRGLLGNIGEAYVGGKAATASVMQGLFDMSVEEAVQKSKTMEFPSWVQDIANSAFKATAPLAEGSRKAMDSMLPQGAIKTDGPDSARWLAEGRAQYDRAALARQAATGGNGAAGLGFDLAVMAPDILMSMGISAAVSRAAVKTGEKAVLKYTIGQALESLSKKETRNAVLWNIGKRAGSSLLVAPELVPMWTDSFARTTSDSMERGADPHRAVLAGLVSATIEMAIERGGVQEMVKEGADRGLKAWAMSVLTEGLEEVKQDPLSPAAEKFIAGISSIPLYSENGDGVIDPVRLAKAAVSGLAGGLVFGAVGAGIQRMHDIPGAIQQATTPNVSYRTETVPGTPGQAARYETVERTLQTGEDKANPDLVAQRDVEARRADAAAAFGGEVAVDKEYPDGPAMWQEAERRINKKAGDAARAAQKEAEVTGAERLDIPEDTTGFTKSELKNAAVPMLDRLVQNENARLQEETSDAQTMQEWSEREGKEVTKEELLQSILAGTAAPGIMEQVQAKAKAIRTADAIRSDVEGIAGQVKREAPVKDRKVLPMPAKSSQDQSAKSGPAVTYQERREVSPAVPATPESVKVVKDVDTSKMLPGLRKKLETTYAKAKDRESEVMALARKGKDRTTISKTLGMHPAEVRAVLQMNGVPDAHTWKGQMWAFIEQQKDRVEKAKATVEAGASMEKAVTEDGKIMRALNSIEEEQRVEAVRGLKRGITRVSDITSGHRYVQQVARLLGKHVVFYEGGDSNGFQTTAAPDTLFVRYSEKADTSLMFVTGHEFLHSLRTDNEALYNGLKSAFEASLTPKQIETILDRYKAEDQGYYERLKSNRDLLIEEIIADQAGNMFTDKAFWDKVYSYDTNLGNRLLQAAKRFLDKLLEYVGASKMDTDVLAEAQLKDLHEKFSKIVADRLAGVPMASPEADAALNAIGVQTTEDTAAPKYNLRTFEAEKMKTLLQKKGFKKETAEQWVTDLQSVATTIAANRDILDFEGSDLYTALKDNSDKQYKKSLDFTTLCVKRYVMQATMEAIQTRIGRGLTPFEWLEVRKELKAAGEVVSCGLCYVEARRLFTAEKTNEYVKTLQSGKWGAAKQTKDPFPKVLPDPSLFLTQEGMDTIKRDFPVVFADYVKFIAAATHGKMQESRVAYDGEIRRHYKNPKTVAKQNLNAGQRIQSWSDFEAVHLLDLMQAVVDMAYVGLKAHAYTKVPDFVRSMGRTGILINMSLIPKGAGLDSKGKLVFDPVEGMPFETAKALAQEFHRTTGTVAIGVSRDQILALLADPDIHYVIPYHSSGMSKTNLKIMGEGAALWTDYTKYQSERHNGVGRAGKAPAFYEWWDSAKTPAENIAYYKALCAKRNLHPRFSGYNSPTGYNADFDFTNDPNYWKMLSDRRMYDADGVAIPHNPVQPIFDDAVNQEILDKYIENPTPNASNKTVEDQLVAAIEKGETFTPSKAEIKEMEKMLRAVQAEEQTLPEPGEPEIVKFSTRRVEEIDKAFGEEGIRDANGKLLPLYHGTRAGSIFSAFERGTGFIDTYLGTHVAVDPEIANQFASDLRPRPGTAPRIYQVFAKGRVFDLPHLVGESDTVSFNRIAIEAAAATDNIDLIQVAVSEQFNVSSATALKIAYAFAQGEDYSGKYELDEFLERMQDTDLTVEFGNILRKYLQDQGYGAVKYRNTNPNETRNAKDSTCYVILDPASIKSPYSEEAVDLENTDIRYSVRKAEIEEAFKDSKVRGADGELVEMYHGTNVRFNVFLPSPKREGNKSSLGRGFYFTSDKGLAEAFATGSRGRVMSVRLNIVDPLSVKTADPERLFPDDTRKREYLRSLKVDVAAGRTVEYNALREIIGEIGTNGIKAAGYDGVIHEGNSGFDEVVVFNSTQVRSVDGNNPVDLTNPDIRYSVRKTEMFDKAAKHFGTTRDFREAGYLLPDGRMLDFSGRHEGQVEGGERYVDHRDIQDVYDDLTRVDAMVDFMKSGAIRLMPESPGIEIIGMPTPEQVSVIRNFVMRFHGDVQVDLGLPEDAYNSPVESLVYPKGTRSDRVLTDIKQFYATGAVRRSLVADFHTKESVRKTTSQYMATKAPSARRSVFDGWTDFYSKMFNKAVRVEQVSKQAGMMANNALASGGIVRNIIERELVDRQGNRIGKSWAEVVKDVIEDGEFWDYMLTKHNISRQLEGKPVIDEDPQVSYLKAQQMEQAHPEWVTKAQEIYDWQDTFMKAWALDTGIIDPITYADWRMAYPHYLPTQREFSDLELGQHGAGPGRKYVNMPMPVKKATGSNRKIIPPIYSVAQMVNTMVRTAAYNDVGKALYDQVLSQPDPKVTILPMAAVIFRRNLDNVVTVWKDGLPHFMQIEDKPLLDALLNLPKRLMMPDFVNKISGGYRGLITHRNPIFAALNFARDAATAYVFGKEWNPLAFARDAAIAAGQIMQTGLYEVTGIGSSSAAYNRYRAVGGGGGGFLDVTDTKKLDAMLKPGARHKLNQIFDTLTSGLGEVTEQMWRLAAFNREMRKTGNVEQALADAMNITVNFARGGSWAKNIDPLMPYTNAYLQGVDTFVRRMFVEAGAPARWAKAVGIVTAPALIQLMMIAAAGEDEWDRYLSIKRETRDAYYHFPKGDGTYVRIPKSRELGVLFGAMAERIVTGDFEEMAKPWFQNFAPNNPFESNLLGGAWYLAKNETFSGATITPEYMKSLDADLQSDENTSSLMVALAKATGVGAKDLQFLFDHYTGIIGDILLPLTAQSGRNTALDVLRRVTTDRFTTDPAYSSQGISDFYDAKDAAEKAARTRNVRENLPSKMQTPEEYFAARLGDVSEAISKGNSYIRTLPASDPAVRQIRETTAKYATRAAKAQTAADLVSIAAQLNAELIRLGVR